MILKDPLLYHKLSHQQQLMRQLNSISVVGWIEPSTNWSKVWMAQFTTSILNNLNMGMECRVLSIVKGWSQEEVS